MNPSCRQLQAALAPGEVIGADAELHLAACGDCRARSAAHDQLLGALRAEPAPIDDVSRARWLARMAPELDAIAAHHRSGSVGRNRGRVGLGLAIAAAAMLAVVAGWWIANRDPARNEVAAVDRELLRPYVITGSTDLAATTLLAGRFAALEVASDQLVRASFDRDRARRIAIVGPARVAVTAATSTDVELDANGTLLVDALDGSRTVHVHTGGIVLRAQHATFAAQTRGNVTVVFVDRGEIWVGPMRLHAGEWFGPVAARSAALVTQLRDQTNAIAPPADRAGLLAIEGSGPMITESGAVLGVGPLVARLDPGTQLIVSADAHASAIDVREGSVARVPAPVSPVISTTPAPTVPLATATSAPTPPSRRAHPPSVAAANAPAVAPAPEPAAETAEQLYARAEAALRAGDRNEAEAVWTQLLAAYPRSPQAATALYDLASLTRAHDRPAAQAYLGRLLANAPPAALREPAQYLSCRLHVEARELDEATRCFQQFRAAFADSPHDAEVLAWLAGRAQEVGGCGAARALADEYVTKYPHGSFAARAASCKDAR